MRVPGTPPHGCLVLPGPTWPTPTRPGRTVFGLTIMNGGDLKFHIYNMGNPGFEEEACPVLRGRDPVWPGGPPP